MARKLRLKLCFKAFKSPNEWKLRIQLSKVRSCKEWE